VGILKKHGNNVNIRITSFQLWTMGITSNKNKTNSSVWYKFGFPKIIKTVVQIFKIE